MPPFAGAKDAPSLDDCARLAILDLADVTPDQPPATPLKAADADGTGDVVESEHSAPMDHVAAPDGKPPPRLSPREPQPPDSIDVLRQVAISSGASPAEARAETDALNGMVEEAREAASTIQLASVTPQQLREHIDALSVTFEAIGAQPTQHMQAAE